MDNQLRLVISLFIFLLVCPVFGQRKPKIKGNRSVIAVEKELPPFSRMVLTENFEVRLRQADAEGILIEADDNLIDVLRFDVDDNTLTVSSFYTITGSKKLELTLDYRQLESIRIEAGKVSGTETLNTDNLELTIVEGARGDLDIQASLVEVLMEGNASADLRITTDSLNAQMGGYTDTRIYSSDGPANITLTGQAALDLEGVSAALTVSLTDNTRIKASGMEAASVTAFLNASANARLFAVSRIAYEGRGSSRLFVYGQPEIQILGLFDRAELHKVPD